jgi:ABC-2 type transport system ATP-binding protein
VSRPQRQSRLQAPSRNGDGSDGHHAGLAVEAAALTKTFDGRPAVDGLNLAIEPAEVFGLLGPNGAGKTTTIMMLTTLLSPTSGSARIYGYDVTRDGDSVRRQIGYVTQQLFARYLLTGRDSVEIEAALYHVPRRHVRKRTDEVLALAGLTEHGERFVEHYSGGMKKRLDLACGLLHHPRLLILDEPTLGLDVQSRHDMWEQIGQLRSRGVTVLLATNYLDEADRLCDRVMIIDRGREVVTGAPRELKRSVRAEVVEIESERPAELGATLARRNYVRDVVVLTGSVDVYVDDAARRLPALIGQAVELGLPPTRVSYSAPTLDDVFLLHTGRKLPAEAER